MLVNKWSPKAMRLIYISTCEAFFLVCSQKIHSVELKDLIRHHSEVRGAKRKTKLKRQVLLMDKERAGVPPLPSFTLFFFEPLTASQEDYAMAAHHMSFSWTSTVQLHRNSQSVQNIKNCFFFFPACISGALAEPALLLQHSTSLAAHPHVLLNCCSATFPLLSPKSSPKIDAFQGLRLLSFFFFFSRLVHACLRVAAALWCWPQFPLLISVSRKVPDPHFSELPRMYHCSDLKQPKHQQHDCRDRWVSWLYVGQGKVGSYDEMSTSTTETRICQINVWKVDFF